MDVIPDAHRPRTVSVEQFERLGWVRVSAAFSADEAGAMREVIWRGLARQGLRRDDPSTWTRARPEHLQELKADPFRAIGGPRTIAAITEVLGGQRWTLPGDWGAFFLQFPTAGPWRLPTRGWHLDADYRGTLSPPCGVKVHAMLSDVEPRGGGTNVISGSHRLVHEWFRTHPAPPDARGRDLRRSLYRHPYLRDLMADGDPAARRARFQERVDEAHGLPLQVVENTSQAGDVILMHALLLHAAPVAHSGSEPRFLLNKDIVADTT